MNPARLVMREIAERFNTACGQNVQITDGCPGENSLPRPHMLHLGSRELHLAHDHVAHRLWVEACGRIARPEQPQIAVKGLAEERALAGEGKHLRSVLQR